MSSGKGFLESVGAAFAPILCAAAGLLVAACSPDPTRSVLTIGAASSAAGAIEAIAYEWAELNGVSVRVTSASSSTLARQIERGSPVDVLVSADRAWVDYLTAAGLGLSESVEILAGNRLVIYARADRADELGFGGPPLVSGESLWPALVGRRWTTGDPEHVPLGRYGREALRSLGWWEVLGPFLLPAADALAAVRLVELGQADFGLGYSTDVAGPGWVTRALDRGLHGPVEITAVQVEGSHTAAAAFMAYIGGPEAQPHWRDAGFAAPQSDAKMGGQR